MLELPKTFGARFVYCFQLASRFNYETEELFDYYIHRKLAALVVATLGALDMPWLFTPNRITFVSLVCGLGSAYSVFKSTGGDQTWLLWAFILELLSITFDCCDGQLARMYNSGSLTGRILDGLCDMTCALAHGFVWTYVLIVNYNMPYWLTSAMLVVGIVAFQQQCMLYDRIKNLYVLNTTEQKDKIVGLEEKEQIREEMAKAEQRGNYVEYYILLWYEKQYMAVQNAMASKSVESAKKQASAQLNPTEYRAKWKSTMRLISWCGTGTHAALFYVMIMLAYLTNEPRTLFAFFLVNNFLLSYVGIICLRRVKEM